MMLKRVMVRPSFATVQDMSGKIQLYSSNGDTGEEAHNAFKHYDLGDILGLVGVLFRTRPASFRCASRKCVCLPGACARCRKKFHA